MSTKSNKRKKIRVLGVATHAKWNMSNWTNGVVLNGGIPEPIGLGLPWGGWLWRTQKVMECLQRIDPSEIVIITDVYDAFITGSIPDIVARFKKTKSRILISVEEYWSPKGLERLYSDFTAAKYNELLEKKFGRKFIESHQQFAINAGQMIGYVKDLRFLFQHTLEFMTKFINDDQAALYAMYLPYLNGNVSAPFELDFGMEIFSTLSNMHQYRRDWEWDDARKMWYHRHAKTHPACLHFAGENKFQAYRIMGRKALGEIFNYNCRKSGK